MIIKSIHGLFEIIGWILMLFLNPRLLNRLTFFLTYDELSEDPKDVIANFLLTLSHNFAIATQHFIAFYLISHGVIKCILIFLLWRKKLWAYPLTIVSLVLFIIYQIYQYTISHSVLLILLTVFDIIMIALTFIEYKKVLLDKNLIDIIRRICLKYNYKEGREKRWTYI